MNLTEELVARIRERALLEERSLSNTMERLIGLGLGTVVTERDQGTTLAPAAGEVPHERAAGAAGSPRPSRSVTVCPNERMHRPGVWCKVCERML